MLNSERILKMSKVQICNYTEREVERINNPRKSIFLTDVLLNAVLFVTFSAVFTAVMFGVCALCDLGFRLMGVM